MVKAFSTDEKNDKCISVKGSSNAFFNLENPDLASFFQVLSIIKGIKEINIFKKHGIYLVIPVF